MANHANAKKAHRQNLTRAAQNKSRMSKIKTFIKRVLAAVSSGSKEEAATHFKAAQSEIMCGVKKNIIKLNTASRKISGLAKKVKSLDTKETK
ncbi:MAG UNVERIFIED_CONTAM: 30S ribosomal protein S20 [Rickettsiaceae bacterium]|jgi:small subunit ribosomal protein S20